MDPTAYPTIPIQIFPFVGGSCRAERYWPSRTAFGRSASSTAADEMPDGRSIASQKGPVWPTVDLHRTRQTGGDHRIGWAAAQSRSRPYRSADRRTSKDFAEGIELSFASVRVLVGILYGDHRVILRSSIVSYCNIAGFDQWHLSEFFTRIDGSFPAPALVSC